MIKHGPIHKYLGKHKSEALMRSHLKPIIKYVTKGIADARENIVLTPQACDAKGAKKFNGQQCVIAKALTRIHKPDAVAVGRSYAYVVQDGLAIRMRMGDAARAVVEEFDARGRVKISPIKLLVPCKSQRLKKRAQQPPRVNTKNPAPKARTRKLGVRASGGGVAL